MGIRHDEILKILKQDLKYAEQTRKEIDEKIATWKSEYNGEPYGNEVKNRSAIVSKDIKKQSEWQHPTLIDPFVSSPDIIKAAPVTFEDVEAARQNELVLNTQFCRQFNRYNFMTKSVKVLDQEGTCVIMTGWEYEDKKVEVEVPIIITTPDGIQRQIGTKMEEQTVIVKNKPTAKVCRNEDVFIDPTCMDDPDNAQFYIYRYETDMSTLKADGRYKNLDKVNIDSSQDTDYEEEDTTKFKFSDNARKKILVHEYWGNFDMNDDGIAEPIVCAWVSDVIIRLQTNPYPDNKPPFIIVPFSLVPFTIYGDSNAELISDNQKVKTAIYRGFIDNMALSNNGQKGIKKGALDPINRKRFFAGENFEFNGSAEDFRDGSYNQLPSSAFDVIALMNNEIESSTGVKSFSQGLNGNSLGSAVGTARGVLDATSTRRLNIVRNIAENLVKPLMRKWMAYNSEFLSEREIIRITNEEFVEIKRDDLAGQIDIDISVSTAEDNATKAQELSFMMQTGQQTMDFGMKTMLMAEIARLHKMPHLAKKLEEYQPQPDPMAVQKAQLEIELLQAQIVNERAKAMENQVDVKLKQAKTQSELAKAGKVGSEADLNNMKFIQEDMGVSHYREMEKKNHDSMTKIQIEAMKANSKSKPKG